MTTLLVVLAIWAVCSVPIALIVARLFRSRDPEGSDHPNIRGGQGLSPGRRLPDHNGTCR
ncbi:hypothetical protein D5S18_16785 [Nocardia panacis]|uniref:Uncharacterized protein n=1 Tax=Nocardia panacis TaxID=2340916 RepID=A0A3A4KAJ0_9NOCA|nr:hypothetical protein [Nocardia panacis]RJO75045.1 hypothetical protein D5S18_16785 [Nocardia panacis]